MNISQFDWIYPKNGVTPQPTDISIEDFLNKVKYGEYKTQVEKVRACKDKNQRSQLKKKQCQSCVCQAHSQKEVRVI